ncbi:hypothetical protein ZIOFF_064653 [Zingiber officinale]|uniref:Uncharacterized protein n=1 Tax=Zingiber officinale TaxID=94328 RepID=A0A8J5EYP2_ZINOF|nr:hypothetical protein ZIOFF_064653 [Zingiber officinale]
MEAAEEELQFQDHVSRLPFARGGPIFVPGVVGQLMSVSAFKADVLNELQSLQSELVNTGECNFEDELSVDELKVLTEEELVENALKDDVKDVACLDDSQLYLECSDDIGNSKFPEGIVSSSQKLKKMKSLRFITRPVKVKSVKSQEYVPVQFPEMVLCLEIYDNQYKWRKDTFCNDLTDPSSIDYSKPIFDWLKNNNDEAVKKWDYILSGGLKKEQKKLLGDMKVSSLPNFRSVDMHKTRFSDLGGFRLGSSYLYCHQVRNVFFLSGQLQAQHSDQRHETDPSRRCSESGRVPTPYFYTTTTLQEVLSL